MWLPDLVFPPGWADSAVDGAAVTRMLVRRLGGSSHWDGCEVLNLYRVPATVPEALVLDNADRTLRNCGAVNVQMHRIDIPPDRGVIAVRTAGRLDAAGRPICGQYSHYVVNTAVGGALIEQVIVVGSDALATLAHELEGLTEDVYRSLLASIETGYAVPGSPGNRKVATGPAAVTDHHAQVVSPPTHVGLCNEKLAARRDS